MLRTRGLHASWGTLVLAVAVGPAAASGASVVSLAAPVDVVRSTTHGPSEFGVDNYTVTTIPAASFTADTPFSTDYGSLFRYFDENGGHFFCGVQIPSGVVIDYIGLHSGSYSGQIVATLFYSDSSSGTTSGIVALGSTPHAPAGTDYNLDPIGWQLVGNVHNDLVLDVYQPPGGSPPWFGWVEIWWRRVVSPPPASPTFADVPSSDLGYQYIEALAASAITGGCGGGNYCPGANLTRRQMAIFLAKALGLHWPY